MASQYLISKFWSSMIKIQKVHSFFSNKLKFEAREKRHTDYQLVLSNKQVPFPKLLRVPRHSRDVGTKELRHIGQVMNLSINELKDGASCNISSRTIHYSLCTGLVAFLIRKSEHHGEENDGFGVSMVSSIQLVLDNARLLRDIPGYTKKDSSKIEKIICELDDFSSCRQKEYSELAKRISFEVRAWMKGDAE